MNKTGVQLQEFIAVIRNRPFLHTNPYLTLCIYYAYETKKEVIMKAL